MTATFDRPTSCAGFTRGQIWLEGFRRELAALAYVEKLLARAMKSKASLPIELFTVRSSQRDALDKTVRDGRDSGLLLHLWAAK